ncbi:YodC family protein [Hyphomicrobium sp.]|uniref:YodC family protein n=1 Tax=Hyphomicrobium sp. TaxID=82 RepID=UPI003FA52370
MALKVGDVVILKSGGPEMTVSEEPKRTDADHVWCQWFGGRKLEKGRFPVASLISPPKKDEKSKK